MDDLPLFPWERDRLIIARYLAKRLGVSTVGHELPFGPFCCPARGYVLGDDHQLLAAVLPEAVDVEQLWRLAGGGTPPYEFWVLEDDGVIEFRELWPPAELN